MGPKEETKHNKTRWPRGEPREGVAGTVLAAAPGAQRQGIRWRTAWGGGLEYGLSQRSEWGSQHRGQDRRGGQKQRGQGIMIEAGTNLHGESLINELPHR